MAAFDPNQQAMQQPQPQAAGMVGVPVQPMYMGNLPPPGAVAPDDEKNKNIGMITFFLGWACCLCGGHIIPGAGLLACGWLILPCMYYTKDAAWQQAHPQTATWAKLNGGSCACCVGCVCCLICLVFVGAAVAGPEFMIQYCQAIKEADPDAYAQIKSQCDQFESQRYSTASAMMEAASHVTKAAAYHMQKVSTLAHKRATEVHF